MHSTLKEDHIAITVWLNTSLSKQEYFQLADIMQLRPCVEMYLLVVMITITVTGDVAVLF